MYGFQPMSVSLMNRTPPLDTVAGLACFMSWISRIMRIDGEKGMRSLLTNVSTLLSSMTVFMDSIHVASMSPSRMTHLWMCDDLYPFISLLMLRKITAMSPSFHSLVLDIVPYNSSDVTALGFACSHAPSSPTSLRASKSVFHVSVFPQPVGPMMNMQCRTPRMPNMPTTLMMNCGSACRPRLLAVAAQTVENSGSEKGSGQTPGNKSWIKRKKMGMSKVVIFGVLKSRRARQSTGFSSLSGSILFNVPACRSNDFTARRPQS
mmetsp:Transcript_4516/g.13036  ORF Transcript_4516/g.13036 Transcript_4516/m.13036 type:complete len:263 (-) Transcript_4516:6177-6965(-)